MNKFLLLLLLQACQLSASTETPLNRTLPVQFSYAEDIWQTKKTLVIPLADTTAPVIFCKDVIYINILPTQMIQVFAFDFVNAVEDDVTPANLLVTAIRESGTGASGFPEDSLGNPIHSLLFNCSELGLHTLEIWVRDQAGNTAFCASTVVVEDALGNCPPVGTSQPQGSDLHVRVTPNPFSGDFQLGFISGEAARIRIKLSDQTGREIYYNTMEINPGNSFLEVAGAALAPGLYFLRMEDAQGTIYTEKVMKQ